MFIYLIYDTSSKLFKIGRSVDPIRRLKNMETGNPNLKLLFFTDTLVENELHKKYQKLKVKGEWYKLGIIELKEIMGSSKNIPKTFFYKNIFGEE